MCFCKLYRLKFFISFRLTSVLTIKHFFVANTNQSSPTQKMFAVWKEYNGVFKVTSSRLISVCLRLKLSLSFGDSLVTILWCLPFSKGNGKRTGQWEDKKSPNRGLSPTPTIIVGSSSLQLVVFYNRSENKKIHIQSLKSQT